MARCTVCISRKFVSLPWWRQERSLEEGGGGGREAGLILPGDCMVAYSWGGEEGALPFSAGSICPGVPAGPLLVCERSAVPLW